MYQHYGTVIPTSYKPISAWGYFGYRLLYLIPVIGWIILIIHAFAAPNINVRRHARSFFCAFLFIVLIAGIILILFLLNILKFDAEEFWQMFSKLLDTFVKV